MQSKTRPGAPHIRFNSNNVCLHWSMKGPDGGGGGSGGYGGGGGGGGGGGSGGVRSAPPPSQQDKAPPPLPSIHHPAANHMMSQSQKQLTSYIAYHTGRPPSQPPPPNQGPLTPTSYLHYATNPAQLGRQAPRQHQIPTPRASPAIYPLYPDGAVNTLCPQFYPSVQMVPVFGAGGTTEGGRPPPSFTWPSNPPQGPVTIMTQPPTAQPNPQQQAQPQPSPYPQNHQFAAFLQPRVSHSYSTGGGGAAGGGGAGVPPPQPTTLLVERPLQPSQAQLQAKTKITRKNRIPIINPDTGMEVNIEESAGAGGGQGGSGTQIQDHSGGSGHPHLHHSTSNQVSNSADDSARIAADFAKQVLQAAMNEPATEPEESQVNGPGSEVVIQTPTEDPAPPPVTSLVQQTKRPPGPTPVVSAQAEGTTYDIQSIRNSNRVEIRSGESSPARNKVQSQTPSMPSLLPGNVPVAVPVPLVPVPHQVQASSIHHHEPSPPQTQHVDIPMSLLPPQSAKLSWMPPNDVVIQSPVVHHSMVPPVVQQAPPPQPIPGDVPKQQRPRARIEEKKPVTIAKPPPPAPIQIEEKEDVSRSRTGSSGVRQPSVPKDEEIVSNSSSTVNLAKPSPTIPVTVPQVEKPQPVVPPPQPEVPKPQTNQSEKHEKPSQQSDKVKDKSVERIVEKPVPETVEKPAPEPVEKVDKPVKPVEKQASPAPVPAPAPAPAPAPTPAPPPKEKKTAFAEGFSLESLKITARAAQSAAQVHSAQTATSTSNQQETSESTESHTQVKSMSRAKQKGKHKMREMNQKGVEKEGGTDMDAFVDTRSNDNNNRTNDVTSRISPPMDKSSESRTNSTQSLDNTRNNSNDIRITDRTSTAITDNSKLTTDNSGKADREKSPAAQAQADATNNNINNQIAQQLEEDVDEDMMVTAKNEENTRKNSSKEDKESGDAASQVIPPSSQASLKYHYKDDQWSPLNPEGKKVYDRDFLMKLREDPLSAKKPDITTDLEIFYKEDQVGIGGGGSLRRGMGSHSQHGAYPSFGSTGSMRGPGNNNMLPDFFSRSLSQRMPPKRNSSQGGGGNRGQGGGRSLRQMYNNSQSLRDEFKLNQSENAWKPAKMTRGMDSKSKEEKETDELYKKVRGILNKLTPQKFETLTLQFQSLPINSLERLQGTIRLVFEKAVDEPAFSVSYAQLCKVLARLNVTDMNAQQQQSQQQQAQQQQNQENAPPKPPPINFRKILLTRCQQEFETNKKLEMDFEKKQQAITETSDPDKKKELQLLFNEEERKIRMKSVGLVTFIGELFKLKMLTANIMNNCIRQLLSKIDEESLECLCKLLTTIGKEFEAEVSIDKKGGSLAEFDGYFAQMTKLSKKNDGSNVVSSRVRFMLQDVIELRQNDWVPRRDANKPKTMAQIEAEVVRETEKAAILAAQSSRSSLSMNQDRNLRRNNPRGGSVQGEDGWTNVPTSKFRSSNYTAEPSKMQGLKSNAGQELLDKGSRSEAVLGPSSNFYKWASNASTASRPQISSSNFMDMNTFSVLDNERKSQPRISGMRTQISEDRDNKQSDKERYLQNFSNLMRSNSGNEREGISRDRDNSRGRTGTMGGSPSPSPSVRKTFADQAPLRIPDQKRIQGDSGRPSAESSRESTPALSATPSVDKPEAPEPIVKKEVSEEQLKQYTTILIKEYIENQNIEESIENYKELFMDDSSVFISTCLNYLLEMSKIDRRNKTSRLLAQLIRHQMFQPSALMSEIELIFEVINDFVVDIPHIWQYMGEIFGVMMASEALDFNCLKTASKAIPSGDNNKLDVTLKEIFKILLLEKGPVWIKKAWDSAGIQIKEFVSDEEAANEFLKEHGFLEGKEVAVSDSNIPYDKVQEKLLSFLTDDKENFDHICGWLTTNVGKRTNDPKFIRELTEAVIKSSLVKDDKTSSQHLDNKLLKKNLNLIKRYVDNKEELELWCLYSVQHLVIITLESPVGMLVEIFRELYESLVVSTEGFNKWKLEEDCNETWQMEGRGVAITSLKSFFQVLESEQDDDPDDDHS